MTAAILSFIATRLAIPILEEKDLVGWDLHKRERVEVAEMGGIGLVMGLLVAATISGMVEGTAGLWSPIMILFLLVLIGLYDDLKKTRGRVKLGLCFLASLTIFLVSKTDQSRFMTSILPNFLIPVALAAGVAAGANATNILAGFNGLEAGTSAIGGLFLIYIALLEGSIDAIILASACTGSCLGFLWFNRFPARVFPGDIGTLPMGGALALAAISAGVEYLGPIIFFPHLIELGCKMKNKFEPKELTGHASIDQDGNLHPGNYTAFVHYLMELFPGSERKLVYMVWLIEVLLGFLAIGVYFLVST